MMLLSTQAHAQTRHEWWSKLMLRFPISGRLSGVVDMRYRRQANTPAGEQNPLQEDLAEGVQIGLSYRLPKGYSVLFYPVARMFFWDFPNPTTGTQQLTDEWRVSGGLTRTWALNSRLKMNMRGVYESRHMKKGTSPRTEYARYRFLTTLTVPLRKMGNQQLNLSPFVELFGKSTETQFTNWDQSWSGARVIWSHPKTDFALGVQYVAQGSTRKAVGISEVTLKF